jgi:DNA invertase Pin-like site-specific DNA recombinase
VIDEDQGRSGKSVNGRDGFQGLVADVGLGRVGIVLGIEVSRLARNNAAWYQLLDLCALTDTLIADSDGIYHPALHNDRLVLGLKGTMSEAELHVLRARLQPAQGEQGRARASCGCRAAWSTTGPDGSGSPRTRRSPTRSRPCSRTSISFRAPGR